MRLGRAQQSGTIILSMGQKFELKGPAGIIAAIVVIGGVLVVKGPSGL